MILQPMGRKGRAPAHVRAWTPEEDALLIALYPSTPVKDIAVRIKEVSGVYITGLFYYAVLTRSCSNANASDLNLMKINLSEKCQNNDR